MWALTEVCAPLSAILVNLLTIVSKTHDTAFLCVRPSVCLSVCLSACLCVETRNDRKHAQSFLTICSDRDLIIVFQPTFFAVDSTPNSGSIKYRG